MGEPGLALRPGRGPGERRPRFVGRARGQRRRVRVTCRGVEAHDNRYAELVESFLGGEPGEPFLEVEVGPALAALCQEARRAWPDLSVDEGAFCRYLGARLAVEDLAAGAEPLPAADLYLACACVLGAGGAADRFIRAHLGPVRAALARVLRPADLQDAEQRVWQTLLVARDGETPRVAQYRGRGPLVVFVRVTAIRTAVSQLRRRQPASADDEVARLVEETDDPELRYLKQRYREEFRRSFATALAALPPPQQLLLRLDVVEQLTIDQAAAIYGRSRTTTGRHLHEARQALARRTLDDLQVRLALDPAEVQSVARLVQSQLDLSVQRLLDEN